MRCRWSDSGRTAKAGITGSLLDSLAHLVGLIKSDLRCRFERGQTAEVTQYLDRFPDLREAHSRVISLIYEEFCLREEKGEAVDVETFLRAVSSLERLAALATSVPPYPEPGSRADDSEGTLSRSRRPV